MLTGAVVLDWNIGESAISRLCTLEYQGKNIEWNEEQKSRRAPVNHFEASTTRSRKKLEAVRLNLSATDPTYCYTRQFRLHQATFPIIKRT